jgi:hypothetical protein
MEPGITAHTSVHEEEFWKRNTALRQMLKRLREQDRLLEAIQAEASISAQVRDALLNAVKAERDQNLRLFHDFLQNLVSFSLQGLHQLDILLNFTISEAGVLSLDSGRLIIDSSTLKLPPWEAVTWMEPFRELLEGLEWKETAGVLVAAYRTVETRYDRMPEGSLRRCSLKVQEEIFPGRAYHVQVRLPAQALTDRIERPPR